jgi:hypothetical protein
VVFIFPSLVTNFRGDFCIDLRVLPTGGAEIGGNLEGVNFALGGF